MNNLTLESQRLFQFYLLLFYLPCCSNAAVLSATGRRWLPLGHAVTPWSLSRLDSKEGKEKNYIAKIWPEKRKVWQQVKTMISELAI